MCKFLNERERMIAEGFLPEDRGISKYDVRVANIVKKMLSRGCTVEGLLSWPDGHFKKIRGAGKKTVPRMREILRRLKEKQQR